MANRDAKLIERVLKDFSLNFKSGDGGGTKVVNELPEVGEEHTIYELQEKKKIPSLIPMINQQMIDDELVIEIALFAFVFDTNDDMVNTITPLIPNNEIPYRFNYVIKEDKLIMSIYGGTNWQFIEATKVSDYKFDLSNALGSEEPAYVVMLKEYLGKTSEESGDIRYTGKLLDDKLYTFGSNTFCIVLGAPTSGIMTNNACMEGEEIPEDTPKELIFEYIPYEKIIKEDVMQWVFKPKGIGEVTVSSYWIYTNEAWFNADEIREFEFQEKTVIPNTDTQEITPDKGYDGFSKVTVNAIQLQNKTVSPTTYTQFIIRDAGFDGLKQVTVNAVTSDIDSDIKAENIKRGVSILGVTGTYEGIGATYKITKLYEFFPEKLSGMTVAQIGSNVYLFGGNGGNGVVTRIYKFNAEAETISAVSTTLPQALSDMGVAQIGNNVYLFGGYREGNSVNTICKFNVETEEIGTLYKTLPQALSNMGVAQIGNNVYLFGGYREGKGHDTIYKFNAEAETISKLSVILPRALYGMGVAQIGNNVYLFGGICLQGSVNDIYKFNAETETISVLSVTLPKTLYDMGVATFGSNVYLFGGFSGTKAENTIYKFNAETETISVLSVTLPKTLYDMGVATFGSNVYLLGGLETSISKLDTIYKFNIQF